jgi:CRISPR-associated helicase Cas3
MEEASVSFTLDGISIKTMPEKSKEWLPETGTQFPPYPHQYRMQQIMDKKDEYTVMNTTVTGGGKTYSYSVPSLKNDLFTIVIFPTNALIKDQYKTITDLCTSHFSHKDTYTKVLTGENLRTMRDKSQNVSSNSEIIESVLHRAHRNNGPSFILTNPDILLKIARKQYSNHLPEVLGLCDTIVVDEFHQSRPKGRMSIMQTLDEYYHRDDEKTSIRKVIFLTATPNERLKNQLKNKFGRGTKEYFYHVQSKDDSVQSSEAPAKWREIMPQIEMRFFVSYPFKTKERIRSDTDKRNVILDTIESGRSMIVVDGASEVNEITDDLRSLYPNKTIGDVSGLRNTDTINKLNNSDIIVGNSTLEVGVDIDNVKNLIFSGFNKSRFMQRLGRLRSSDDSRVKNAICFTTSEAVQKLNRLAQTCKSTVPRERFEYYISKSLSSASNPETYRVEFAPIELIQAIENYTEGLSPDEKRRYRKNAMALVEKNCFSTIDKNVHKPDLRRVFEQIDSPLSKALQSYRASQLTSLLYDERTDSVKTYSTLTLLRSNEVSFMTWPDFEFELRQRGIDPEVYQSEKMYVESYAVSKGPHRMDTLRSAEFVPDTIIQEQISKKPLNRFPEITDGIEIDVRNDEYLTGLQILNKCLRKNANLIIYSTEGHPAELQTTYNLDEFFFTTEISNMNGNYAAATGENALYLYCYVQENIRGARAIRQKYS